MTETVEKKVATRNLERISTRTYRTYEDADYQRHAAKQLSGPALAKAKIFARYDGTYDLVLYKKIETPGQKVIKALEEAVEAQKPVVHGQKSKDRKKSPKKAQ